MKTKQEYITILQEHTNDFTKKFGIRSMSLFGSVARNEQHDGSDVDVFVDMPASMRLVCGAELYLKQLLGCDVDLVRKHNNLSDFFIHQVKRDGINIF